MLIKRLALLFLVTACNNGPAPSPKASATEPEAPLTAPRSVYAELADDGGTCSFTIYCSSEAALAPYDIIVTGEIATQVHAECREGKVCPYKGGDAYTGILCDGKDKDEAVDVTSIPCGPESVLGLSPAEPDSP